MSRAYPYVTNLDIKFAHLERIDVPTLVGECKDRWFNQTLTKVNESVVRLGIVQGEYHWHKHDRDDEFFFVLEVNCSLTWKTEPSSSTPTRE
jgi:hypothetical protein